MVEFPMTVPNIRTVNASHTFVMYFNYGTYERDLSLSLTFNLLFNTLALNVDCNYIEILF